MRVLIILILFTSTSFAAEKYLIPSFNYPPILTQESDGILDLITKQIKNLSSLELEVKKYPIKRSIQHISQGDYAIHVGGKGLFTNQQLKNLEMIPLFDYKVKYFYKKSEVEDFSQFKRIGAFFGSDIILRNLKEQGFYVINGKSIKETFSLLLAKRVDAITCLKVACLLEIKSRNLNIQDFAFSKETIFHSTAAFFINKNHKDYKNISVELNKTISKYLQSSSYYELLELYFGSEIPAEYLKYTL